MQRRIGRSPSRWVELLVTFVCCTMATAMPVRGQEPPALALLGAAPAAPVEVAPQWSDSAVCEVAPRTPGVTFDTLMPVAEENVRRGWASYDGYRGVRGLIGLAGGNDLIPMVPTVFTEGYQGSPVVEGLRRAIDHGHLQPGMVAFISADPKRDPNAMDRRSSPRWVVYLGKDGYGNDVFADAWNARVPIENVPSTGRQVIGGIYDPFSPPDEFRLMEKHEREIYEKERYEKEQY